jgi:hypothetical protein
VSALCLRDDPSVVHADGLAGDVAARLGAQPGAAVSNVFRLAGAPHRDGLEQGFARIWNRSRFASDMTVFITEPGGML